MIVTLTQLWLPILVAAAAVWFWAFLSWAILPVHRRDNGKLPGEDGFLAALRGMNVPHGSYLFPYCTHAQHNDPEVMAKWKAGPTGTINVWNPSVSMGRNMILSFLVYVVVSLFIAYLAVVAGLPRGTGFMRGLQFFGTAGILAYSFAFLPQMIWFQANKPTKVAAMFDGIVSGLATGLVFAMLWPK